MIRGYNVLYLLCDFYRDGWQPQKWQKVTKRSVLGVRAHSSYTRISPSSHREHTHVNIILWINAFSRFWIVSSGRINRDIFLFKSPHTFSIGFMSGQQVGQSIRDIPCSSKNLSTRWALWGCALSPTSTNRSGSMAPATGRTWGSRISLA